MEDVCCPLQITTEKVQTMDVHYLQCVLCDTKLVILVSNQNWRFSKMFFNIQQFGYLVLIQLSPSFMLSIRVEGRAWPPPPSALQPTTLYLLNPSLQSNFAQHCWDWPTVTREEGTSVHSHTIVPFHPLHHCPRPGFRLDIVTETGVWNVSSIYFLAESTWWKWMRFLSGPWNWSKMKITCFWEILKCWHFF